MYLNKYDFGYQADGIRSAAKIFFNKTSKELSIEESATLVGMLKNSSLLIQFVDQNESKKEEYCFSTNAA